jgi:2-polyprenyl-3-methyl-5-hydroxy-6-metoxy-1,4-benzoquinol methylase
MLETARPEQAIRMANTVIGAAELERRLAELLANIDTDAIDLDPAVRRRHGPLPYSDAERRAEQLHALWATVAPPQLPPPQGLAGRGKRFVKRVIRKATAWYVEPRWSAQHEVDAELARFASDAVLASRRIFTELRDARQEIDTLVRDLDRARNTIAEARAALQRQAVQTAAATSALDQLMTRDAELERLVIGRASTDEVTTLREQTTQLMERLGVSSAHGASFDYVAFEDRFRGSSDDLAQAQRDYVTKFPPASEPGAIVDIGCGRGEMVEVLRQAGHDALGVDTDANMVALCQRKGLPVELASGTDWLEAARTDSLKGVFCAQVVEHLITPELERFLRASFKALRHGGVLVVETINPRSLHALANHFFADLSHVRPIHPETLRFMCEQAGFAEAALVERSPHPALAEAAALPESATAEMVRELVGTVYGMQDYFIVATKLVEQ